MHRYIGTAKWESESPDDRFWATGAGGMLPSGPTRLVGIIDGRMAQKASAARHGGSECPHCCDPGMVEVGEPCRRPGRARLKGADDHCHHVARRAARAHSRPRKSIRASTLSLTSSVSVGPFGALRRAPSTRPKAATGSTRSSSPTSEPEGDVDCRLVAASCHQPCRTDATQRH